MASPPPFALRAGSADPAPVFAPLGPPPPPVRQAFLSTLPSRARLGTGSLAQPLGAVHLPGGAAADAAGPDAALPPDPARRSRRVVNYAESDSRTSVADWDDAEREDDTPAPARSRRSPWIVHPARPTPAVLRPSTPAHSDSDLRPRDDAEPSRAGNADGKAHLGQDPPAMWIMVHSRAPRPAGVLDALSLGLPASLCLVPIRVEFDTDELRIKDLFTWNVHERSITPEMFAVDFCCDLAISEAAYAPVIVEQIKNQLRELSPLSLAQLKPDPGQSVQSPGQSEPDLRVIIQLDVQIQTLHLMDKIEWDIASDLTPELFACQYIRDLNLPRSALPVIAHAIHEELIRHKRDCIALGLFPQERLFLAAASSPGPDGSHPDGDAPLRLLENSDPLIKEKYGAGGSRAGPKRLEGVWRDWNEANLFGPKLEELHPDDLEWIELEKERALKRSKRESTARNSRRR